MPELLLELGCEELPATSVRRAFEDLRDAIGTALSEAGLLGGSGVALGTPRRLIVSFADVAARQEDQVKEQRGPALKSAYNDSGEPTPALLGFCRSSGVEVGELRKDDQYVWADKKVTGRLSAEILAEALPKAIRSLSFEKTMRWGSGRMRFARPIRWMVALLDGQVVPFEIEGVPSGNRSRGHRFYAPEEFEVRSYDQLLAELRKRSVEPDPETREGLIRNALEAISSGTAQISEDLLAENVFLTEWPTVVEGSFPESYLELPTPVLVTAMAKHEKMFPIRDKSGDLANRFLFVRNAGEDATVRKGAEWVLSARFNDAKFFHDEDRKSTLDDFLEKTSGIVFAEKLGTVRQRADRLAALAEHVAEQTGADRDEQVLARNAGLYAKADLSTGLVSEMASLQGVVGSEYAKREGILDEICWALRCQYDLSLNSVVDSASARTAVRLILADQLDKLAGYLGVGLAPTGSSDPYGLRRAATLLIEAAWRWPSPLPAYSELLAAACEQYTKQGFELDCAGAERLLGELFASRYDALLTDVRYDVRDAALLGDFPQEVTAPQRVRLRTEMLTSLLPDVGFIQTATRPINIVSSARKKEIPFLTENPLGLDLAALDSADAAGLYTTLSGHQKALDDAVDKGDKGEVLRLVCQLGDPIVKFFDSTMVMAEEEDVRFARLSLMWATALQLFAVGDFSKLVLEG